MENVKTQWRLFLLAVGFFTRIPIPTDTPNDEASLNACSRYFGVVGLIIGLLTASVYTLAALLWSQEIAVVMCMTAAILISGALHEDGLADTFDGLGGAFKRREKLRIMKDSRVGGYGVIAVVLALLLKFNLLTNLQAVVPALIVGAALSRVISASLMWSLTYVREGSDSKVKSLTGQQQPQDLVILVTTGIIAALIFLPLIQVLMLTAVCITVRFLLVNWLHRQIAGYTGDTLGAAQQLSELAVYATLAAMYA